MSDQKPIAYQFIIERWAGGLKVLGAGHGAGILASAASIQYFSGRPEFFFYIKLGPDFFVVGVIFFAVAFVILTILPLVIEGHHTKTNKNI
jgi:hypothetical protein